MHKDTLPDLREMIAMVLRTLIAVIIGILLISCVPERFPESFCNKAQKSCGVFNGIYKENYWNLYKRGIMYAEHGCFECARQDLEAAIELWDRPGYLTPSYGMHYIDYFPYRELGLVYYRKGQKFNQMKAYYKAREWLERSIVKNETAKALYFRKKIKEKEIENGLISCSSPTINLDGKLAQREIWTNASSIEVSGTVTDPNCYVAGISVGKEQVFLQGAKPEIRFRKRVLLRPGQEEIVVTAHNLASGDRENETSITVQVHQDRSSPIIAIDSIHHSLKDTIHINGQVLDNTGITELRIDGQTIWKGPPQEYIRNTKINHDHLLKEDQESIVITAFDRVGNSNRLELSIDDSSYNERAACGLFADLSSAGLLAVLGKDCEKKTEVNLHGYIGNRPESTVYQPNIPIYIFVCNVDRGPQVENLRLLVNGKVIPSIKILGKETLKKYIIKEIISLTEESNTISLEVEYDDEIERPKEKIDHIVYYKKPAMNHRDVHLTVAVSDFLIDMSHFIFAITRDEEQKAPIKEFPDMLKTALKKIQVLDMDRFSIVAKEKKHDLLIEGRIEKLQEGMHIISIINYPKLKAPHHIDVFTDNTGDPGIEEASFLASEILLEFPLLSGNIQSIESKADKRIKIAPGHDNMLTGRELLIFDAEPTNSDGDPVRTVDATLLETATIIENTSEHIFAKVAGNMEAISKMDVVIAK